LSSVNDTTIIHMFLTNPDLSVQEQNSNLLKLENPYNVELCEAILGRIRPEDLIDELKKEYYELKHWAQFKKTKIKQEQIENRKKNKQNKFAERLLKLYRQGRVSEEVLLLYGISGNLPEKSVYQEMTAEERRDFWNQRSRENFESDVDSSFFSMSRIIEKRKQSEKIDWIRQGF